ncbi:MAG: hypothetical protein O3B65_05490, partial [Chloroflexi bacterium]|nr:hypothetical protein [Chloroflexota bacterium]
MTTKAQPRLSNVQTRLLTAVVGIPILAGVVLLGGYLIAAVAAIVVLFALRELLALVRRSG